MRDHCSQDRSVHTRGSAGSASLELLLSSARPCSITEPRNAPRIITRPQGTLQGEQEASLSPFHPWSSSHQGKLFSLAVPGSLHLSFQLSSGSFSEIKTPYNSIYSISEHSIITDFSAPWSCGVVPAQLVTEAALAPLQHCTGISVCAAAPRAQPRTCSGENTNFFLISDKNQQSQHVFSCLCGCIFTTKQSKLCAFFYEFYKFFVKHAKDCLFM